MPAVAGPVLAMLATWLLATAVGVQEPKTSVREYVTFDGTVERVDRVTRLLTLRAGDRTQTVYVPPEVSLFDELGTGDRVLARVRESVVIATRPGLKPKMAEETTAEAAKARGEADPRLIQQLKAVVTIESVDPKAQLVTYKTADGRTVVRSALDPKLLEGLQRGDVIEVTLTRERVVELQRRR